MSRGYYSILQVVLVIYWNVNKQKFLYAFIFNCIAAVSGPLLRSDCCVFENHAGTVTVIPQDGALCSVNGSVVTHPCQLTQGKRAYAPDILLMSVEE